MNAEGADRMRRFIDLLRKRKYAIFIATALLAAAVALIMYFVHDYAFFKNVYGDYMKLNEGFEKWVTSIENKPLAFLLILVLFALKTFVAILPYNAIYLLSGVIFSLPMAFCINVVGSIIQMTLSFYKGRHFQSALPRLLRRFKKLNKVMERDGGNLKLLFALRVVPFFPMNTVSQLYGGVTCPYSSFIVVSVVGMIPKLVEYTLIGKAVFDPLSLSFLIPFGTLVVTSLAAVCFFDRFIKRRNAAPGKNHKKTGRD